MINPNGGSKPKFYIHMVQLYSHRGTFLQDPVGSGSDAAGDLPEVLNESSMVGDLPARDVNSSNNETAVVSVITSIMVYSTYVCCTLQKPAKYTGWPAEVRPKYIFDGNI